MKISLIAAEYVFSERKSAKDATDHCIFPTSAPPSYDTTSYSDGYREIPKDYSTVIYKEEQPLGNEKT